MELLTGLLHNETLRLLLLLGVFLGLAAIPMVKQGFGQWFYQRSRVDWALDLAGLGIQGTFIPWLQVYFATEVLTVLFPQGQGVWRLPSGVTFLLSFVAIDYAFYWNHRLLHRRAFWPIHHTHHSARTLDVWASARNSLWASFFLVYLWLNGALFFLTQDTTPILAATTLHAALDLWRHSQTGLPKVLPQWLQNALEAVLITPTDHAWHHSREVFGVNFGANFNLWDRLHGTFLRSQQPPQTFGTHPPDARFLRAFLRPLL